MVWAKKTKKIEIAVATPHANAKPKVQGRAPARTDLVFTASELFGAAAGCSHLHMVDMGLGTAEAEVMARVIERYVDDVSEPFAITADADTLKDYVKSYFAGTVGAGLAYLAMISEGYVWSDHFENLGGGNSHHKRTPDYAFTGPATGLALMEAKGSRSGTVARFDQTVHDGYEGQIEPHLGHLVGGQTAVRGYAVGAWMKSTAKAELRIHHTAAATPPAVTPATGTTVGAAGSVPPVAATDEGPSTLVQRNSFATAFALAHSPAVGEALRRSGDALRLPEIVPFLRFEWLGATWVTNALVPARLWERVGDYPQTLRVIEELWPWQEPFLRPQLFAIKEDIAAQALNAFLGDEREVDGRVAGAIDTVGPELRQLARSAGTDGEPGAVFPDGLALVRAGASLTGLELIAWRRDGVSFLPL